VRVPSRMIRVFRAGCVAARRPAVPGANLSTTEDAEDARMERAVLETLLRVLRVHRGE